MLFNALSAAVFHIDAYLVEVFVVSTISGHCALDRG
jgi:hypothetical protein